MLSLTPDSDGMDHNAAGRWRGRESRVCRVVGQRTEMVGWQAHTAQSSTKCAGNAMMVPAWSAPPDGGTDSVSVQRPNAPAVPQQCSRRYCRVDCTVVAEGVAAGRGASHDLIDRPVRLWLDKFYYFTSFIPINIIMDL